MNLELLIQFNIKCKFVCCFLFLRMFVLCFLNEVAYYLTYVERVNNFEEINAMAIFKKILLAALRLFLFTSLSSRSQR